MDFIKKNYEKVLLGLVLAGMAVGAVLLILMIPAERAALETKSNEIISRPAKPLTNLDLTLQSNLLGRVATLSCLNLSATNKVFNPIKWLRDPNGEFHKEVPGDRGPDAVIVTRITNLYTTLTLDSVMTNAEPIRYIIGIQRDAAPQPRQRAKRQAGASIGTKTDTFILRKVNGPPDNPTTLEVEMNDTGEIAVIPRDKPYRRVDGYLADMMYKRENKTWPNVRVGAGGPGTPPIMIEGESYIVVAISQNEVVLSHAQSGKKTPRPYSPGP